jgi:hypothetical protein
VLCVCRANIEQTETASGEEEPVYHNLYLTLNSVTVDVNQQPPRLVTLYDAEDTNLAQLLQQAAARGRVMPEDKLAAVVHQLLLALKPLHDAELIHGNLDASAVFISNTGRVRLGNLMHSTHVDSASCRGRIATMGT